jgi:hypothetical protein
MIITNPGSPLIRSRILEEKKIQILLKIPRNFVFFDVWNYTYWSLPPLVCLCLSVCLSVSVSVYVSFCPSFSVSKSISVCVSLFVCLCLSVCFSLFPSSICLSPCLSLYLSQEFNFLHILLSFKATFLYFVNFCTKVTNKKNFLFIFSRK